MTDVVAVALITGGFGAAGNLLTYRIAKQHGRRLVAVAGRQAEVELEMTPQIENVW